MKLRQSAQHGFAAIAAIFLVLVLAAFGAFMISFSNTQQLNSARDGQGSRAYWAARAGLEWGVAGVFNTNLCPVPSSTTMTIDTFTVTIDCDSVLYTEGAASPRIFQIVAVARSGPATDAGTVGFVERSVSASVER